MAPGRPDDDGRNPGSSCVLLSNLCVVLIFLFLSPAAGRALSLASQVSLLNCIDSYWFGEARSENEAKLAPEHSKSR